MDQTKKVDRLKVRELAERHCKENMEIAKSGGNVYQKALENQDEANEIASGMNEEDATVFLNTYTEELNALTNKIIDDQSLDASNSTRRLISLLVGLVAFIIIMKVLFD